MFAQVIAWFSLPRPSPLPQVGTAGDKHWVQSLVSQAKPLPFAAKGMACKTIQVNLDEQLIWPLLHNDARE